MKKNISRKISAFTLIELMVVITIIAILSSISITGLTSIQQKSQDTSRLASMRDIQLALEAYKSVNNKYPEAGNTTDIIPDLHPDYISKLPADTSFKYTVSTDRRSYCLAIKGTIFKVSSQAELVNPNCGDRTWISCKGKEDLSAQICPN